VAELLACLEVEPRDAGTPATVVWLHGLGADGYDFAPIVPMLGLPHARFVFPHAPAMPVTINGGHVMPAWYDIRSLDRVSKGPEREHPDHIRASARRIAAVLEQEIDRGVRPDRIVLAGFSQGAAMALHVGPRFRERLAGIVVLSGYIVLPDTIPGEWNGAARRAPMLFAHGRHDDIVPIDAGREAIEVARQHGDAASTSWHEFSIGHEVSTEEIGVVARWLQLRLP
jgi:phospholipase/carboxylesterase